MSINRIYECEYCEEEFSSKNDLRNHKKNCDYKPKFDYECGFCDETFPSKIYLREHMESCSKKPEYICYGCNKKFNSKSDLGYHQTKCKKSLKKCNWITKTNKRCNFIGRYEGYCKKHYIDYKYYDPNGITDKNNDTEVCTSVINIKYCPSTISHMISGEFYSLEYKFRDSSFTIKQHNITNIIMENTETGENVTFWESKDARKHKPGQLIKQLSADYQYECENISLVVLGNETHLCKKCFENQYNSSINSLVVKTQDHDMDELVNNTENMKLD